VSVGTLAPAELARRLAAGAPLVLLDVREPHEWSLCHIAGAVHIPLGELARRHAELDPDVPTVCICHHGIRSAHAAALLASLGFAELYNLAGGIDRWASEVDPKLSRY
jgi:rhodanese-related sulfurtransferase